MKKKADRRTASTSVTAAGLALAAGLLVFGISSLPDGPAVADVNHTARAGAGITIPVEGLDPAHSAINQALSLLKSEVVALDVPDQPGASFEVATAVEAINDGKPVTLAFWPHSVRDADFRVMAQIDDGSRVEINPGPERTLRGHIVEVPGAQIAGSLFETGLSVMIVMPDGEELWMEALATHLNQGQFEPGQHVVFSTQDAVGEPGVCGVTNHLIQGQGLRGNLENIDQQSEGGVAGDVMCVKLAIDADFEYFQQHSSSETNVINNVTNIVMTANLQFENETGIKHVITEIIVRTSSAQNPYTTNNPQSLLDQFRSTWNSEPEWSIDRDVAHLFTGRNLSGSAIGIAQTNSMCNKSWAYGISQNLSGAFFWKTDLFAHEIGHNWSATHCTCSTTTMHPSITGANTFIGPGSNSVNQIVNKLNSSSCPTSCAPGPGIPDSCIGNCGGQLASGCWCDGACHMFGDCCQNICDFCAHGFCLGPGCEGHCGGQSPMGCWCDVDCLSFSDCCTDACDFCPRIACDDPVCAFADNQPCCEAHGGLGCNNFNCCLGVSLVNEQCGYEWTAECVAIASERCSICQHGSTTHHVPGDFKTIQQAVDASGTGDTIIVAPGTYFESLVFEYKSVEVRSSGGPAVTTIDAQQAADTSTVHVQGGSVTLEGFTITGGTGTPHSGANRGGGIRVRVAQLHVIDCIISDNVADWGGGMHAFSAQVTVTDSEFVSNDATVGGGGVLINTAFALFEDCLFQQNTAAGGGGINVNNSGNANVVSSQFIGNEANFGGGALVIANTSALFENCLFDGNKAVESGGLEVSTNGNANAVSSQFIGNEADFGGGALAFANTSALFEDCFFENNKAVVIGGGINVNNNGNATVVSSQFLGNESDVGGGAFVILNVAAQFSECLFENNIATTAGGGVRVRLDGNAQFDNCEFIDNQSESGGGVNVNNNISAVFTNARFKGNTAVTGGGISVDADGTASLNGCEVTLNAATTVGGGAFIDDGGTLEVEDTTVCNNTPGNITGAIVDLGGNTVLDECPLVSCPGDINEDGVVNGFDLVDLLSCWGPVTRGCEPADINGDEVVNGFDLVDLLSAWGPCP